MKQNITFLNLSNETAFTVPSSLKKRVINNCKQRPFIIVNTDNGRGMFVKSFIARAKALGLKEIKDFRIKSVKKIKKHQFIVFGDAQAFNDYDYRVETDSKRAARLDGRRFKVYDLVNQFDKAIRRLEEYAKANRNNIGLIQQPLTFGLGVSVKKKATTLPCAGCPLASSPLRSYAPAYSLKSSVAQRFGSCLNYAPAPLNKLQDVKVHLNFVKIGYEQYDIVPDAYGRQVIQANGEIFFVKEDRYGNRYLAR